MIAPLNFIDDFYGVYPEFKAEVESGALSPAAIEAMYKRIVCIYPLESLEPCRQVVAQSMLVAHYLCYEGKAGTLSKSASPMGQVISSSVGGVSVSLAASKASNLNEDFFSTTPYGREYLAFIAQMTGAIYVN